MPESEPLIGPDAHERERNLTPEQVQLADGSPVYHALMESPTEGVANQDEARRAKSELREIIAQNPEIVLSCQGKSAEEAREILRGVSV